MARLLFLLLLLTGCGPSECWDELNQQLVPCSKVERMCSGTALQGKLIPKATCVWKHDYLGYVSGTGITSCQHGCPDLECNEAREIVKDKEGKQCICKDEDLLFHLVRNRDLFTSELEFRKFYTICFSK